VTGGHRPGSVSEPLHYADGCLRAPGGTPVPAWPRFALLGDPVGHSLSPVLHAAALRSRGEAGAYAAIRVSADDLPRCLLEAHRAGVEGVNLTLPHKRSALACAARLEPAVELVGAANTLVPQQRGWGAHNTDVPGLALALHRFASPRMVAAIPRAVVLGSGGAARAVVVGLGEVGLPRIRVLARRPERAAWARAFGCEVAPLDARLLADCGLLVQATPLGLLPDDPPPIDPSMLPPESLVLDLTYGPQPSQLLLRAATRGCPTSDGLPMLVAQAALAFALWRGGEPPLQLMGEAVGLVWE
jgi:shikimate dehydrogenase